MLFGRLWNWAVDVAKMRGSRCPCLDARGRQLSASRVRRQNQCRAVVLRRCDTVSPDGKMKGIERRVYKILRPEGREYAVAYAYIGSDTHVGSMRGWCIPKEGKDYEVKDRDAIERTVGGAGELVTDLKLRSLAIPAGEP